MRYRIAGSVATAIALWFALTVYENFLVQEQAKINLGQLNGTNGDYGVARMASRDYSSLIVFFGLVLLAALWVGPVVRLARRITAER